MASRTSPPPRPKTSGGKPDFSGMWVPRDVLPCNAKIGRAMHRTSLDAATRQLRRWAEGRPPLSTVGGGAGQEPRQRRRLTSIRTHTACPPTTRAPGPSRKPRRFSKLPPQLVILHEFNASYRQIFFDGRKLPEDMLPTWNGYSVAHWEGDTLVVESAGYRDDSWLDTAKAISSPAKRASPSASAAPTSAASTST